MSVTQASATGFSGAAGNPAADAFYLPADSHRQARLWLPWPINNPALQTAMAAVVHAVAAFEPVSLLVSPGHEASARAICGVDINDIVPLDYTSLRLRDTGPTFLVDGKGGAAAVDWRFNGWGARGDTRDADLAHVLLGTAEVRRFRAPLTLEGSSFVADGRGTLLALSSAVFDSARNPGLTQIEAFGIFQGWLDAARVIWLPERHPGDRLNTDVRALAVFVEAGLCAITAPGDDPVLAKTAEHLAQTRDGLGTTLELVRLPAPPRGPRALSYPLSYTSFLPVNGGLLVPAFDAPSDARAADMLAEVFPDRSIRLVPASLLAESDLPLTSLAVPHPARLLERDRATVLQRSAWSQPATDAEGVLQHYADMASGKR
jgi:agmatine deiminase